MDNDKYFGELDMERRKNRRLQLIVAGCVAAILVQASAIRAQTGETRTAFVPPEISKPFWISGESASAEYFEQLGQYINGLPLNITPETVQHACRQYLAYVVPKDRDKHKKRCDVETARVKRDGASQMFAVREVNTDAKNRRVAVAGVLTTIIQNKAFKSNETYMIEFAHSDGRFYVANHEKVDQNDPFAQKK